MTTTSVYKIMTRVLLAASVVLFGAAMAQAKEGDMRSSISVLSGMDIHLGGQLNRQVVYVDNGTDTATGHTDNSAFPSYVRLKGRTRNGYGPGLSWGFKVETGINSGPSENFNFSSGTSNSTNWETRASYVWLMSDKWGKVAMGRGPGAARYSSRKDLSGTERVHNFDSRRVAAIPFREDNGSLAGLTVSQLFPNNWGVRADQLLYKSPEFANTRFKASFGNNSEREYSLNYRNYDWKDDLLAGDDTRIAASIGHVRNVDPSASGDQADARLLGSASILHPSGLNLTLGYVNQDPGTANTNQNTTWSTYTKLGYRFGNHSTSVDYGISRGSVASGGKVEGTLWGLGYGWSMGPYGLGIGVEQYDAEFVSSGLPNIDSTWVYNAQFNVRF
ncbi:MAG: porin [Leptospirillia bacterium]